LDDRDITAAILVIGDEILSGRTKDKNIGLIADQLTAIGIRLREVRVVADEVDAIVAAVNELRTRYDFLFTTGGIGPTHDDITADSMAAAFAVPIDIDPRAVAIMQPYYESRGLELTPARLRMARIPEGATLIHNPVSSAPAFMLGNVVVMAGVPWIMEGMLAEATKLLPTGRPMLSETIPVDRPESEIAELLSAHQAAHPDVRMGSYPQVRDGRYMTELVLRSTDPERLRHVAATLRAQLERK